MIHKFTVPGQPIPYTRTTTKGKFVSEQWQRYAMYKNRIAAAFVNSINNDDLRIKCLQNLKRYGKVLHTGNQKIYVSSIAYFANKKHGDMDNIHKGILDALFVSDKYVAGAFDFYYDAQNPRLEVTIWQQDG